MRADRPRTKVRETKATVGDLMREIEEDEENEEDETTKVQEVEETL